MQDGSAKAIEQVRIGDHVKGGKVTSVHIFDGADVAIFDYLGVPIAGDHSVKENDRWIKVRDSQLASRLSRREHYVYDIDTTSHRISLESLPNVEFADYSEVDYSREIEQMELSELNNEGIWSKSCRLLSLAIA